MYYLLQIIVMLFDVDFERFPEFIKLFLPKLIVLAKKDPPSGKDMNEVHGLVKAHTFIATLVNNLAITLSFGLLSPYVALAVAVGSTAYYRRCVALLWYYSTAQMNRNSAVSRSQWSERGSELSSPAGRVLSLLNVGFFQFWRLSSRKVWTFGATASAFMLGLALFDMSADGGASKSKSSSGFLGATLFVVFILFLFGKYHIGDAFKKMQRSRTANATENPIHLHL
jgi:hypothetical protein